MIMLARIADRGPMSAAVLAAGLLMAPVWLALLFVTGGASGLVLLVGMFAMLSTVASAAVVTFVALRHGEIAAVKVFAACLLMLLVVSLTMKGSAFQIPLIAVTVWLPPIFAGFVLTRTVSMALAVITVGACSALAFLIIAMVIGDTTEFLRLQFNEIKAAAASEGVTAALPPMSEAQMEQFLVTLNSRIISSLAISVVSFSIGALFLARYWQARLFNPGGFQKEFHQLSLGRNVAVVCLVITGVCLIIGGDVPRAVALVFVCVLAIQGLAVVHALVKQRSMHRFWLHGIYMMVLMTPVLLLLAALGLADNVIALRQKEKSTG